jgi:hypothetical protein
MTTAANGELPGRAVWREKVAGQAGETAISARAHLTFLQPLISTGLQPGDEIGAGVQPFQRLRTFPDPETVETRILH